MKRKTCKKICCVLCSLVNLFSANKENTQALGFRDICRYSAKGTATVVRHVTSWITTAISGVSMVYVFQSNLSTKEKINFYVLYTGFAALGILNTCDMIYEHTETKEQQKNNNKEKSIKDKNS